MPVPWPYLLCGRGTSLNGSCRHIENVSYCIYIQPALTAVGDLSPAVLIIPVYHNQGYIIYCYAHPPAKVVYKALEEHRRGEQRRVQNVSTVPLFVGIP